MLTSMAVAALAVSLVLASAPSDLSSQPGEPLIFGGEPVYGDELAQVVAIQIGPTLCTGTVVSQRVVLTAGHCFASNPNPEDISVKIGDHILAPLVSLGVTAWGRHPDFCAECEEDIHDFGYLILQESVGFEEGFAPPLATAEAFEQYMTIGQEVWLVGYGEDEEGERGQKRKVGASIRKFSGPGGEFLAGGSGKDSCFGDSGGPALLMLPEGKLGLAGVLSRGYACGEGGFYGIPYPVLCWLRDETGVDLADGCEACDCLTPPKNPEEESCRDCSVGDHRSQGPALALLLGLLVLRRRR